jgi:hypothetical protein
MSVRGHGVGPEQSDTVRLSTEQRKSSSPVSVSLPPVPAADPAHAPIAEPWRDIVAACLQVGERVLIALELDLDRR